jgi:hypothetical protein
MLAKDRKARKANVTPLSWIPPSDSTRIKTEAPLAELRNRSLLREPVLRQHASGFFMLSARQYEHGYSVAAPDSCPHTGAPTEAAPHFLLLLIV